MENKERTKGSEDMGGDEGNGVKDRPKVTVTSANSAFRLAEYTRLTSELQAQLEESWRMEKLAFSGAAALVAWLAAHPQLLLGKLVWLPLAFVALCCVRFGAAMWHIVKRVAPYLQELEEAFLTLKTGAEEAPGKTWERFFRKRGPVQIVAHCLVWIGLLATASYFAWQPCKFVPESAAAPQHKIVRIARTGVPQTSLASTVRSEGAQGWTLVALDTSSKEDVAVFRHDGPR